MKYTKYLLLLLLVTSCASRRTVQHRSYQADPRPYTPATVQVPTPVVVEEEEEVEEPVVSARPLVSQVRPFPVGSWQANKQQALDMLPTIDFIQESYRPLFQEMVEYILRRGR